MRNERQNEDIRQYIEDLCRMMFPAPEYLVIVYNGDDYGCLFRLCVEYNPTYSYGYRWSRLSDWFEYPLVEGFYIKVLKMKSSFVENIVEYNLESKKGED